MNLNRNPNTQQLARLIAPLDDTAGAHLLWVTKTGDVKITRVVTTTRVTGEWSPLKFQRTHPEMLLYCDPFLAGNEYVGLEAAKDEEWLTELLNRLLEQWHQSQGKAKAVYVDIY